MRQLNEQRDKEEAELLHKLSERRKEAAKKYLSHFTVDRHQKIIRQGDIDMESLLPPLQGPAVSTPDLSLTTFMDQRGDQLKQYVGESIKMHLREYEKSAAPSFPSRESNTEPPASNTSAINGSPLTQPSYGMPMHAFVSPSQSQPLGTRQIMDAVGPYEHHLRQSGYTGTVRRISPDRPTRCRPAHKTLRSHHTWPDHQGTTPNNSAPLRTVRCITPDRPDMLRTVRYLTSDRPDMA
jgi:hypothetical protein